MPYNKTRQEQKEIKEGVKYCYYLKCPFFNLLSLKWLGNKLACIPHYWFHFRV